MKCKKGRLCSNFVFSSSVTVGTDALTVNVPYLPSRGCIAITQAIPDTATVNLPVVITVGTGTEEYPLVDKCGVQVSAGRLDVRHRYSFKFIAANTTSIVKICNVRCQYNVIPVSTTAVTTPDTTGE